MSSDTINSTPSTSSGPQSGEYAYTPGDTPPADNQDRRIGDRHRGRDAPGKAPSKHNHRSGNRDVQARPVPLRPLVTLHDCFA